MIYKTIKYEKGVGASPLYEGESYASALISMIEAWKKIPANKREAVAITVSSKYELVEVISEGNVFEIIDNVRGLEYV